MNVSPQAVDASYAACRQIAREANSSFFAAFVLLPRAKRRAMDALYAFMRHTDDLVDLAADDPKLADRRREALLRWRTVVARALESSTPAEDAELQSFNRDFPPESGGTALLPALADTVARFQIPPEHLYAVIDGVEIDLTRRRYETFEQLEQYCRLVASAVGLACIHVWGFTGDEALPLARKCGVALQLTNILRDVAEDGRRDRVYLPLEDLRKCDYSVDDLLAGVADDRFLRLMELEIDQAERLYREGAELIRWLEPDGRRVFGMMTATYHALLEKIARRPADVLKHHVRLGCITKLRLAARWMLLPPRLGRSAASRPNIC